MIARLALCTVLATTTASAVHAQSLILTEKEGRALIVGGQTDLAGALAATSMAPSSLGAEFARLCLPLPDGDDARVAVSPLQLKTADTVLPATGGQAEVRPRIWAGPSAVLSVWNGNNDGLKGRPIAIHSRGYTVTSGYGGRFSGFGPQCNLVVAVPDYAAATGVIADLNQRFGAPGKLVQKSNFADGFWIAGDLRININVPMAGRGQTQPIHLSAQRISSGASK